MQTVQAVYHASSEEKKSTFIAFLCPIEAFEALHVRLKNEHPKAAHIVWAKRVFNEYRQIVEDNSDDGEPKGTSGPPILSVMRGFEIVNAGILIVRYFGGIKLGTGGLVRAYGNAAKEAIGASTLVTFEFQIAVEFFTPFALLARFEHYCSTQTLLFQRTFDTQGAYWKMTLSEAQKEAFVRFAGVFESEGFKLL